MGGCNRVGWWGGGCKGVGWWNGGMQGGRIVEWGDALG